jgi:5'-nucleotidase
MRFLVTNDDGIDSVFLHELVHALHAAGHELTVVAPKTEQSWIGAAKSRNRAVSSERIDCKAASPNPALQKYNLGCPTWIVDGTPSDCVNIALAHLVDRQPDAVVSGINLGLNTSLCFILASGTIAGAWEGALHGLPGVALSQDLTFEVYDHLKYAGGVPDAALLATLKTSAAHAARLVPALAAATAPQSFVVHNLNFPYPCLADSALRRTVPARVVAPGLFGPAADDGTHRMIFKFGEDLSPPEPLTDRTALATGFISHTVLDYTQLGRTP